MSPQCTEEAPTASNLGKPGRKPVVTSDNVGKPGEAQRDSKKKNSAQVFAKGKRSDRGQELLVRAVPRQLLLFPVAVSEISGRRERIPCCGTGKHSKSSKT